jgi:protein ImuB
MSVTCVLLPRFALMEALDGEREALLSGPAALAPLPGGPQLVGEVSGPAEALGIRPGMRLGEALGRCPELALVPPDEERTARSWEGVLRAIESIGAAVESQRAGEAQFETDGLRGIWGGRIEDVLARVRRAIRMPARLAAAPGRFCAYAAASRTRSGRDLIVPPGGAREFLAPLPVALLAGRITAGRARYLEGLGHDVGSDVARPWALDDLPNELERLGIQTLGQLAELPRAAVADRLGRAGLQGHRLASGKDDPLVPRRRHEALAVGLELPDAVAGTQLERALELLIDRLLAHPVRRGRAVRALRLSARLAGGGGWRREVALRRAGAVAERLRLVLVPVLSELPGPVSTIRLEATALAAAAGEQLSLASPDQERRRRLSEAVRQARAAAGGDAVLRVLDVEPESRIPERRAVLTPFPELDR